jgi:hypothetical protein
MGSSVAAAAEPAEPSGLSAEGDAGAGESGSSGDGEADARRSELVAEAGAESAESASDLAKAPERPQEPADASEVQPGSESAAAALAEIEKEAERIRKEREELQKAKEEAGKAIAAAPRRPLFGPFGDPGLLVLGPREVEALMRQQMEAHRRVMEQLLRARPGWGERGLMPGQDDRFEAVFDKLRREMEAFEREAEAMMRAQRALALRFKDRGGLQLPPGPGLDVPPPPEPGLGGGADEPGNLGADGQPQVRRRRFVTPDGAQVETFELRWGFTGP